MATFNCATHFLARVNILKITVMYVMMTSPFVFVCVCVCTFMCNHVYIPKYMCIYNICAECCPLTYLA